MRRMIGLMIPALLGSGCDSPAPAPQREIMVRSEAQKRLFELDETKRQIGLKRAMNEAQMPCPILNRTAYAGRYKNMDMWVATCANRDKTPPRDWALFVGADDSVQVRLCADTDKVGLPGCAAAKPIVPGAPIPTP